MTVFLYTLILRFCVVLRWSFSTTHSTQTEEHVMYILGVKGIRHIPLSSKNERSSMPLKPPVCPSSGVTLFSAKGNHIRLAGICVYHCVALHYSWYVPPVDTLWVFIHWGLYNDKGVIPVCHPATCCSCLVPCFEIYPNGHIQL